MDNEHYENGCGVRAQRMPDAVLQCVIDGSTFRCLGRQYDGENLGRLYNLMHATAEEVLARVEIIERATEAKPSASAAPGIDTKVFRDLLTLYAGSTSWKSALVTHIDTAIAVAREEVREEMEAAHSRALTRTEMEARNAGYAEADADLRARLAAPEGYVLVPKEANSAMVEAYTNTINTGFAGSPAHGSHVWDAMLAAAPQAKAPQQPPAGEDAGHV